MGEVSCTGIFASNGKKKSRNHCGSRAFEKVQLFLGKLTLPTDIVLLSPSGCYAEPRDLVLLGHAQGQQYHPSVRFPSKLIAGSTLMASAFERGSLQSTLIVVKNLFLFRNIPRSVKNQISILRLKLMVATEMQCQS